MAIVSKSQLKNWFQNGLKPVQEHFWNWMDSYWHKGEKIPKTSIDGLEEFFNENTIDLSSRAMKDASNLSEDDVLSWQELLGYPNFAHLNDQEYVKYDESTGRLESGKISETPAGIDVNGNIKTQAVELENETETPLPNQITRNGNALKYTNSSGVSRNIAYEPRTLSAAHNPPTVAQITSLGLQPGEFYKCSSTGQISPFNGEQLVEWTLAIAEWEVLTTEQKDAVKIFNLTLD